MFCEELLGVQLCELAQFRRVQIRNRPVCKTRLGPMNNIEAGNCEGGKTAAGLRLRWPDKQINYMLPALKHQSGYWPSIQIIQPAACQAITLRAEILHLWRKVQLSRKPGLHGVLIGRAHIDQM